MADASRDQNFVPTLLAVSNADGTTPIKVYADPTTHRLLVDISGGAGTVTSVSVVTANGFAGSVADPTTTPAITLSTTVTGIIKGNGTAMSAAVAGTDYVAPGAITTSGLTQATARLLGRTTAGTGAVEEITVGSGLSFAAGTLSATGVAGSIVVGTTTITSGTNTRILYDNAGVLGEYTITGTGTVVAMQTAPTFVTSITTPSVLASSNDSGALGASGTAFSDLFLASGALIDFAAGNAVITHSSGILTVSTGDLRVTTAGTNAASVATLNGTQSFQNKTLTNSNNTLGGVTMTLGADASYDMYYRSAGGVLTRLANGTTGQFLAATTGAAPSWGTPSSGSSFRTKFCTIFETAARFTTASSSGSVTFDNSGVNVETSGGSAKYESVRLTNSAKFASWAGSPAWGTTFAFGNISTTGSAYFGIGAVTVATTGHTFTDSHIGFKVIISGGTASLYATQANGTTETASSALTTLVADDVIDLYLQVNSTTSVDYYWKKNGGSWSSATNLTTNMPTTTTAQGNQGQWSMSNDNTTGSFAVTIIQASYER